jgi:CubicO group peptidase (beta-lactamase class C family)
MVRAAALLLVLAALAVPEPGPADLAPVLAPLVAKHGVPALAAAIVEGDATTALGASGVRARGSKEPVLPGDRFHLGSCTKAMTATLCAMLVEEKKLAWDAPAAGALEDPAKADPGWKTATLEHLLTMRAGAPPRLDEDGLWARLWGMVGGPPAEARRELARGVLGKPPLHAPGTKTLYANSSYALAGVLAEKAAGRPFEDLLRERLFKPLGMDSAGFGAPGSASEVDGPRGHGPDGKPVAPGPQADNPSAIAPAGTVHASLGDWAKFAALHLEAARGRPRLLKAESFRRLHEPAGRRGGNGYAMGWGVGEVPGLGRVLEHAGSNTMWFCVVRIAPEKGFAALAACNDEGGGRGKKACEEAIDILSKRAVDAR